uniref:Zinc finger, CCHC-type n=1 Tax=Fagus sylvatica TaxID=28930 RepID=A0A2N9J700_FAGSY
MGSESEMVTFKMMNQDFVKLDKFNGTNFTRWKDKLMFLLTALKIAYVLDLNLSKLPEPTDNDSDQLKAKRKKREEDEVVCRGHILNTLSDRLNKKKQKKDDHKVPNKANMVEENSDIVALVSNLHINMISKLNMTDAKSKSPDWWYDIGAVVHVCNNKSHFKSLEEFKRCNGWTTSADGK